MTEQTRLNSAALSEIVDKFISDGGTIKKLPPKEAKDAYKASIIGSMTKK